MGYSKTEMLILLLILVFIHGSTCFKKESDVLSCTRTQNITIFLYYGVVKPNQDQLNLLFGSLLREHCIDVWIYSRTRKHTYRMNKLNSQNILNTEIDMYYRKPDINEFLEFISKLHKIKATTNQTLLCITDFKEEKIREKDQIVKELKYLQDVTKFSVVVVGHKQEILDEMRKKWLPPHRSFVIAYYNGKISQIFHKDILNVLKNPNYDRFKEYQDLKCTDQRKLNIYFWVNKKIFEEGKDETINHKYLSDTIKSKFPDLKISLVHEYIYNTASISFPNVQPNVQDAVYMRVYGLGEYNGDGLLVSLWSPTNFMNILKQQQNLLHINIEWNEKFFQRAPQPFTFGKTINITLNNEAPKSPVFQDGQIVLFEEDLDDPLFINMLIDRIDTFCIRANS